MYTAVTNRPDSDAGCTIRTQAQKEHPMYQKVLSTLVTASSRPYSHYLATPMVHRGGRHTRAHQCHTAGAREQPFRRM